MHPSRRPLLLVALGVFAGGWLGGVRAPWIGLGGFGLGGFGLVAALGLLARTRRLARSGPAPAGERHATWKLAGAFVLACAIGAWRAPRPGPGLPGEPVVPRVDGVPATTLRGPDVPGPPWLRPPSSQDSPTPDEIDRIPWSTGGDEVRRFTDARRQVRSAAGPGEPAERIHTVWGPESVARCAPAATRPWDGLTTFFDDARASALARTRGLRDERTRGLVRALCLGDRSELDPGTTATFTRTGTRHMLALSGLHVGLVAVWMAGPLARLLARSLSRLASRLASRWPSRRGATSRSPTSSGRPRNGRGEALLEAGLRSLAVLAMVPMAGGQAPVVRAAIAVSLASLGPCLACSLGTGRAGPGGGAAPGRRVDALTLWGFALLLECLVDPSAAHQVRVRLSYGATLALILGLGGARRALFARLPGNGRIAPTDRLGLPRPAHLRVPLQVAIHGVVTALAASTVAVLGTLAVTLPTFGEVAPIGILATPMALPPLALALALGWIEILLPGWLPASWLDGVVQALFSVLAWADRCPGSPWVVPERPAWLLLLLSVAWIASAHARGNRGSGIAATNTDVFGQRSVNSWFVREVRRVACLATAIVCLPWAPAPSGLEVVALDAGHGSAIVLRAPGLDTWVFDAGSRDRGQVGQAVARQLARWDVGRVHVVVSHDHHDHRAGVSHLIERFPLGSLVGAVPDPVGTGAHGSRRRVGLGTTTLVDTGVHRIDALLGSWAPGNEGSISLVVRGPRCCLLLCADAEDQGWDRLLETNEVPHDVDLMLLPHHGAIGPMTAALLDQVAPRQAWVSGPRRFEAAPLLEVRGIPVTSTGDAGSLRWCETGTGPPGNGGSGRLPP